MIDFSTVPEHYRHWRLTVDGRVATLALDVDESGGINPGYELKLNSYDLGVDIELKRRDPAAALRASGSGMRDYHLGVRSGCSVRAQTSRCWGCPTMVSK